MARSCHSRSVKALVSVAASALPQMVDPATGLYARKTLVGSSGEFINSEPSLLYSATTSVGILAADRLGLGRGLAELVPRSLDTLHRHAVTSRDPALLAAVCWASALADDRRLEAVLDRLLATVDSRTSSTMGLGLALAALATAAQQLRRRRKLIERATSTLAEALRTRFSPSAHVFDSLGRRRRPRDLAMSQMTSFASQVYPIHGLSEAVRLVGLPPPTEIARVCDRLCKAQGPLGQWWWIYHLRHQVVVEPYPVYSVHQDAMAFMALAAAERIGEGRYGAHLDRGLRWVYGTNELGTPLVCEDPPFIFRAVQRSGGDADGLAGWSRMQRSAAIRNSWIATRPHSQPPAETLELLRECRSYHLGWILYAATLMGPGSTFRET